MGSIGIEGLIYEGCGGDSGKEDEERIEGGEGQLIWAVGVRMIIPCTNLNHDILHLERSGDPRTQVRSFRLGFMPQQSRSGAPASQPRPC